MNSSFDDQFSQSTNDQRSETSSARPPSPRRSSSAFLNSATSSLGHPQQSSPPKTNQKQQPPNSANTFGGLYSATREQQSYLFHNQANNYHDLRTLAASAHAWPTPIHHQIPIPTRRSCTGVDKLIMAAMLDESAAVAAASNAAVAAAAAAASPQYMPSGRGIAYYNGQRDTYAHIPTPSTKSELDLYHLLERANLLSYFGTFINFGGDDVQQLSDADEEEFLEIMRLVGMTQKPLHVRRLQKALIEWRDHKEMESQPKSFLS